MIGFIKSQEIMQQCNVEGKKYMKKGKVELKSKVMTLIEM